MFPNEKRISSTSNTAKVTIMKLLVFSALLTIPIVSGLVVPHGNFASMENFPYIVSLQKLGNHFCSGVIIDSKNVLSAASCFDLIEPFDLQFVRVVAGSSTPSKNGVEVAVSDFLIHENHVNVNVTYDAVIVKLAQDLTYSDKISPAILSEQDVPAGSVVNITGFNINQEVAPQILKYAEVEIIQQDECHKIWPQKTASNQLFCAGDIYQDVCKGDAGAPMVLKENLIGYSSLLSCNSGKPSLFTKISSIRSWIRQNTGA